MEPEHLTPGDSEDIRLERLLRASAPAELPDAGFSRRVLAGLPGGSVGAAWWRSPVVFVLGGAAAGMAVILLSGGWSAGLAGAGPSLSRAVAAFSTMLDQPGVIVALGVAAAALALFSGNEAVE
jgi:hypothetical protein